MEKIVQHRNPTLDKIIFLHFLFMGVQWMGMSVNTRFSKKLDSWCWTWVDVVFLLIWCDVVRFLELYSLILSRLDAYAWFEEMEHVMFLKFVERLRLIWRSGARDFLRVGWMSMFDLRKRRTWCSWSLSL